MKTTLLFLTTSAAAMLPASATAEFAGLHLPSGLNPLNVLIAFIVCLIILTAFADYSRMADGARSVRRKPARPQFTPLDSGKSAHPLAA